MIIKCQECGEKMIIDRSAMLTSLPPRYTCTCPKCGNIQYEYCTTCDSGYSPDEITKAYDEAVEKFSEIGLW